LITIVPDVVRRTVLWSKLRHKFSLVANERVNSHFTGFLRLPSQFDALAGPVLDHVISGHEGPLRIAVMGCSNGAEAYTIARTLLFERPGLPFEVRGYDIDERCVEQANCGRYASDEIFNNSLVTDEFVAAMFDCDGTAFVVKPAIARHVSFALGDVLRPDLRQLVGTCDIVFSQNFLFHLRPPLARRALENLHSLVRSGSAMFLDGVDIRQQFTRRKGLIPVQHLIEPIHEEARRARGVGWPYHYWGLEPFRTYGRDWPRRYATMFLVP
jgi:chemotaxis methyl-accepting protein methylase